MHIVDGILSSPVFIGTGVIAAAGVWRGLRDIDADNMPFVAMMTAGFFLASLAIAAVLALSGREFRVAAQSVVIGQVPVMVMDGLVTSAALVLLLRVRPDLFLRRCGALSPHQASS